MTDATEHHAAKPGTLNFGLMRGHIDNTSPSLKGGSESQAARGRGEGAPGDATNISQTTGHAAPNSIRCPCGDPMCVLINAIKDFTGWTDKRAIDAAYRLCDEAHNG